MDTVSKEKTVAIVVHACDRYQLLYKGFEFFFKKHWPEIHGINCYFLTETIDFKSDIFINIKTDKGEWSDRLKKGLIEIKEEFVMYVQEDMWFKKAVNTNVLKDIFEFAFSLSAKLIKLHSSEVYSPTPTSTNILGLTMSLLKVMIYKFTLI